MKMLIFHSCVRKKKNSSKRTEKLIGTKLKLKKEGTANNGTGATWSF